MMSIGQMTVRLALMIGTFHFVAVQAAELPVTERQKKAFLGDSISQAGAGPKE